MVGTSQSLAILTIQSKDHIVQLDIHSSFPANNSCTVGCGVHGGSLRPLLHTRNIKTDKCHPTTPLTTVRYHPYGYTVIYWGEPERAPH